MLIISDTFNKCTQERLIFTQRKYNPSPKTEHLAFVCLQKKALKERPRWREAMEVGAAHEAAVFVGNVIQL